MQPLPLTVPTQWLCGCVYMCVSGAYGAINCRKPPCPILVDRIRMGAEAEADGAAECG
jgi:hypothetical protein